MSQHETQPRRTEEHHEEPASFINTPKQLIVVVVLAFVVPITVILILALFAARSVPPAVPTAQSEEAIAQRLKPIGEVAVAAPTDLPGQRGGKQVYAVNCAACHTPGVLGAPRTGDAAAWAPLIQKGIEQLTINAIKGIGKMPPRGGDPTLSDEEIARAVAYIANQAGAKFEEPAIDPKAPKVAAVPGLTPPAPIPPAPAPAPGPVAAAPPQPVDPAKAPPTDLKVGKAVHDTSCLACHGPGVAGAPRDGDKAGWAPRLQKGMPTLYANAIKGIGAMPPRGGNLKLSDEEVRAAVDYMVSLVK
jgi:cytochrome c5